MTNEEKNNALRLVYTLARYDDATSIKQLARILNYDATQLIKDIEALKNVCCQRIK